MYRDTLDFVADQELLVIIRAKVGDKIMDVLLNDESYTRAGRMNLASIQRQLKMNAKDVWMLLEGIADIVRGKNDP
jgi:hypothetical protein